MKTSEIDRLVPRLEACRIAGVKAPSTLWRWEIEGLFPRRRISGRRRVGYLESELRTWLKQRTVA